MPDTEISLGEVFVGCKSLRQLSLPNVIQITERSFFGCSALEKIEFNNLQSITGAAFQQCGNLKEIVIPSSNKYFSIDNNALVSKDKTVLYYFPAALTGEFTTNAKTEVIFEYAFSCSHLEKVCFSEGVHMFGRCPFESAQVKSIIMTDNVHMSEQRELATWCPNLTEVKLSANLYYVPGFYGSTALEEIDIPEGICAIPIQCFNSCSSLKKIRIPSSLQEISGFSGTIIDEVHCNSTVPQSFTSYPFLSSAKIYVPKGSKSAYQEHKDWKKYTIVEE